MSALPKGWVETTLGELCQFNPKHDVEIDRTIGVSFIPMPAVDDESGTIADRSNVRPLSDVWKGYTHFADGDVIFAKITPCMENGKIAVSRDLVNGMACGSTEFHVLRSNGAVKSDYVWRFLRRREYRLIAERSMTGAVGQRRVPKQFLEATEIPLPPLAEQTRIVAKLDALSAKSTRARTELARIETLVARYKQAVLSKALSGELTREWRRGVDWPAPKRLGDVASSFAYGSAAKSQKVGSVPVLRMGNIQQGKLDWSDLVYTDDKAEIAKYHLKSGDVLFNRTNSPALVGKTAMFTGEREAIFAGYLIRVVVGPALKPEYLTYALNSPDGRRFSWDAKTDGVSQSNISASKLKEFSFSVPTIEEQHEIVRRIESAFAKIDRLAAEAKRALDLLGKLDEAILAKAFRGELVPQDETDEPASALLARIRAERAAAPKGKRGQRKASTSEKSLHPRRATEMIKSRRDVEPNHLAQLLKAAGGRTSASELWLQSGMNIDEFYKQLRTEIDSGQISEGAEKGELVSTDAN